MLKNEYFRIKVNNGNSYYPIFKNEQYGFGGLWVGWSVQQFTELKTKIANDGSMNANDRELSYIVTAMENNNGKDKIIFTWDRGEQKIAFWKITSAQVVSVPDESVQVARSAELETTKMRAKDVKRVNEKYAHIGKGSIIPCTFLCSVMRHEFPAFIDSLAVYTYLNVGTFRALDRLGQLERQAIGLITNKDVSEFAQLVASYFEWTIDKHMEVEFRPFSEFLKLDDSKIKNLIFTCMSPAQLETFGALLLLDLGLTLEIGIGKSQSDIDLRASFKHKSHKDQKLIWGKLEECFKLLNVKLSPDTLNRMKETKTVFIQCKNYSQNSKLPGVIYMHQASGAQEDCINLNSFVNDIEKLKTTFPIINDWIEQSIHFYKSPTIKAPKVA